MMWFDMPTQHYNRRHVDKRVVSLSFVAGLVVGVPLTYCAFLLPLIRTPFGNISDSAVSVNTRHDIGENTLRGKLWSAVKVRNATDRKLDWVDGIFWTETAESVVPRGFSDDDYTQWRRFLNISRVLKIEEGCGRMQNRLVILEDGAKSCCRYRHNNDQIQGEIFSFYLGRLLGIRNLSPSSLALVDGRSKRWALAATQISLAQWSGDRPVVLTQFVHKLQPALIPHHFRDKHRRLHPVPQDLANLTTAQLSELVQWSDLVLFDYLTANLDRVVNNMYNERWNPQMMSEPTHNLAKTPQGLLVFLDNESGLLHGYRLLEKYEHFHRALLHSLCVFRKRTVAAIQQLYHSNSIETVLKRAFLSSDPGMSDWLPFLPERSIKTLKSRLSQVHHHVKACMNRFGHVSNTLQKPVTDR